MRYPKHSSEAIKEPSLIKRGLAAVVAVGLVCTMVPVASNLNAFADDEVVADNTANTSTAEGELLVVYSDEAVELESADKATADQSAELLNAGVESQEQVAAPSEDAGALAVVQLSENADTAAAMETIQNMEAVESVQPNFTYSLLGSTSDPYNIGSYSPSRNQYYLADTGVSNAWDHAKTNGNMTVAVLDTGCNLAHEDLAKNVDSELAYDATSGMPLKDAGIANNGDAIGHGTMVAGVISAQADNGIGIAGASYNASVLPVKVFDQNGQCTSASMIAGFKYLEKQIDSGKLNDLKVINISSGYYASNSADKDLALQAEIKKMRDEYGVLTVCAGGNGTQSGTPRTSTCYPSDFPECLSVTALDTTGALASFSDRNECKDISAPGVDILSTSNAGSYATSTGSSMAAPIVSGTAALLWAHNPNLTCSQVVDAILETAEPLPGQKSFGDGTRGALNALAAMKKIDPSITINDDAADLPVVEGDAEENDATENLDKESVMGSSISKEDGFAPEVYDSESTDLTIVPDDMSEAADSWRFDSGQIMDPADMRTDGEPSFSLFSIVQNNGSDMYNWFDNVGGLCPSDGAAKGIDVSKWNGSIDWNAVKNAGVDFAIIRCGYGSNTTSQDDEYFISNVRGCVNAGIPFGMYLYAHATDRAGAANEAQHAIRMINAAESAVGSSSLYASFVLPFYYDMEASSIVGNDYVAIASGFLDTLRGRWDNLGVYANKYWWENYLTDGYFNSYSKWIAQYNTFGLDCRRFNKDNDIWQYSSAGAVPGVNGNVDMNYTHMTSFTKVGVTSGGRVIEDGYYEIASSLDGGKVLDISGSGNYDGANLQLWSKNGTEAQAFYFEYTPDGFYTIYNANSNKVLDVTNSKWFNGVNVQQWSNNGSDAQKWRVDYNNDGTFTITCKCSGRVMDVQYSGTSDGTNIHQWYRNGSAAQKFYMNSLGAEPGSRVSSIKEGADYYISTSLDDWYVVDITNSSPEDGANVQLWSYNASNAQKFRFTYTGDGYYTITSVASGKVLDDYHSDFSDTANIWQYAANGTGAQKWRIIDNGDGTYTFLNKTSGKAMDVRHSGVYEGNNIFQYSSNGTSAQRFKLWLA